MIILVSIDTHLFRVTLWTFRHSPIVGCSSGKHAVCHSMTYWIPTQLQVVSGEPDPSYSDYHGWSINLRLVCMELVH